MIFFSLIFFILFKENKIGTVIAASSLSRRKYPLDSNQLGYSFTHNFLSDLGGLESHSG